jgi:peptidoglycan/xylan/chitin deacetylase (PgdA/CDA1 family)
MTATALHRPDPVRQLLRTALLGVVPRSRLIASLPPGDPAVALTFDDGPHPEWTPRVLDALAQHGARATFFVVGERAARHPGIVQRIAAEGHAVGHHSWTHSEPAITPARLLLAENRKTRRFLEELLQRPAPLFRPPHGKVTPAKLLGAWAQGNIVVLWNRDPKDFQMPDASELRAWATNQPVAAGDIVLLHDTHAQTADALPYLLASTAMRWRSLDRA